MAVRDVVMAAAGQGGEAIYVDDVFSTYLYTGNGSTQTINNGIDLAGEGGLVWIKSRSGATYHDWFDTARGVGNYLFSNTTDANVNSPGYDLTAFNSNGFSLGPNGFGGNANGASLASWTFRKAPKFFDVVTWIGDGTFSKQVLHSLESSPGFIITKRTDSSTFGEWAVWHRNDGTTPKTHFRLNGTNEATNGSNQHTSTYFKPAYVEDQNGVIANQSGATYVAYLFAHDAGGFGESGNDNVISCGSYTGTGAAGNAVTLGYEPQWLMIKKTTSATQSDWVIFDNMRGWPVAGSADQYLWANSSNAEGSASTGWVSPNATGFQFDDGQNRTNGLGETYIYIAIRRPHKPPTSGTEVFSPATRSGSTSSPTTVASTFPLDLLMVLNRTTANFTFTVDRLRNNARLSTSQTSAEDSTEPLLFFPTTVFNSGQNQYQLGTGAYSVNASGDTYVDYRFRRAPGFFDVVCYTGTGSARTVAHNLGVAPELMIVKSRTNGTQRWRVYVASLGNTQYLELNTTNAVQAWIGMWNNTSPTSSVFTVGTDDSTNQSAANLVAYLFATLPGISKVGSYTGNGTSQTINCGFTAGARFVLVKRTDSTGNWFVWDSARGINPAGTNDPYLLLNSTAAEVTTNDSLSSQSVGFGVIQNATTNINVNAASYSFLAIA